MPEKRPTVLIVEDDELIAEALSEGLTRAKVKVLTATDGEAGLETALKSRPDHIILDLMMPKMNGHEMLAELRRDKWGAHVPVTVLTNATDNLDIYMATQHQNTHYAIKSSMTLEDIVKTVKNRLPDN
jgi:two-component system alkaline phosphatase synthesis response regulator PhoP